MQDHYSAKFIYYFYLLIVSMDDNCMFIIITVLIGKILIFLSRKLHIGGGSTFPGRVAIKLYPQLIKRLSRQFSSGCVIVTATNGKTTTTRMIASGLKHAGKSLVYNISGANMRSGIATSLIESATLLGRMNYDIGLFEVDEGVFPSLVKDLNPRIVLIGNFFRDQLDRYGEVAILASKIKNALDTLKDKPHLILNADDPMVAHIGEHGDFQKTYFGIDDKKLDIKGQTTESDINYCVVCNSFLEYRVKYIGHLGDFYCPKCSFCRPSTDFTAKSIKNEGFDGQKFDLQISKHKRILFNLGIPGEHSVYNTLAAVSLLHKLDIHPETLTGLFAEFRPPYGRYEKFIIDKKSVYMILIKNPAGANVILRTISRLKHKGSFLFMLNDLPADGRDVSWIFDAHFELINNLKSAVAGGRRAEDMALRLVYAGVKKNKISIEHDYGKALDKAINSVNPGGKLFLLPTYTAMHSVRAELAKRTSVSEFWKD